MARTSLPVYNFRFVMCFCFLWATAHAAYILDGGGLRTVNLADLMSRISPQRTNVARTVGRTSCSRGDTLVRLGTQWNERCRQCTCTESGTQCTGPTCPLPYQPLQEITCGRWTDDCCCAELGCMLGNGTVVPVGGAMPFDPARPCEQCTCRGGKRTSCLLQSCWPPRCVDGVKTEGQCCPACPNGRSCFIPDNEARRMSPLQLRALAVVHESSPLILRAETAEEVSCTCQTDSIVATCSPPVPASPGK